MTDWQAIQSEYQQGVSLRSLAAKHGVGKSTIERHVKPPQWDSGTAGQKNGTAGQDRERGPIRVLRSELPSIPSAVDGAKLGIDGLVTFLRQNKTKMDLMDHVKAATALYQYNRIIVNATPEDEEDDVELITINTRDLSVDGLAELKAFALKMKEREVG